ncbi:MAG TPA: CheR family methyltransferase [Chloroflexota bacterium]|jgi:chemotaxis protein methyltransferase CheR|nr:CheR family methyltransferase [Chloroflexota bacterium]
MAGKLETTSTLDDPESEVLAILRESFGYEPAAGEVLYLRRRLREQVLGEGLETTRGLREKLLHDPGCRDRLYRRLSRPEKGMFDDADFYRGFLINIVPLLRTYPFIRIWQIGCWTGEQVYAMAILLKESGLYDRCRLYATDSDDAALRDARAGTFDIDRLAGYEREYRASGGHFSLRDYYKSQQGTGVFDPSLRRNMIFAQHNLMTDGVFNEFHVIVCRDLLSLFDPTVAMRVVDLLRGSLVRLGFLSLGETEQAPGGESGMRYEQFGPAGTFRRIT